MAVFPSTTSIPLLSAASSTEIGRQIYEITAIPGFQDPFSAISHLAAAGLFLVLGILLVWRGRASASRMIYLGVYAFSCVFLMSMSGVYHTLPTEGAAREVLLRLDHSAIFVLIAGTFTPIHGLLFHGKLRWVPLLFVWIAAAGGIIAKTVFYYQIAEWFGLTLYLAMGWFGVFSGSLLGHRYGAKFIHPLLFGGIAYSVGAVIDFLRWPILIPGVLQFHELFHVAVIVGAILHWRFVWKFAAGDSALPPLRVRPSRAQQPAAVSSSR